MKRLRLILAAAVISASAATAIADDKAEGKERGYLTINRPTAEAHIGFLASDELQGREAGYPSGRIAANYVEACLRSIGLEPWDGKSFRQPFAAYRRERQKKGRYTVHPDSIAR